jgi:uncharacterized protein
LIRAARLVVISLFTFTALAATAECRVPPTPQPVMDEAGLLDPSTVATLERGLRNLKARGGPEITVLIVPSLEGTPIEQATIMATDRWKMGSAKSDDGVLFLIASKDRRMRIEVGVGLQGELTDADSKRIVSDEVTPLFREGRYDDGVASGVIGIIRRTNPDIDPASLFGGSRRQMSRHVEVDMGGGKLLRYFLILLFILFIIRPRRRRSGFASGLMWGGLGGWSAGRSWGSGGGFGGGGGGWGGGGGGFNGGGASGSW